MPRPEIRDLDEDHLPDAARLLAGRHVRHRRAEPLLDERYERPDIAAAEVAACFDAEGAGGAVALVGGRAVGYVLGAPRGEPWGPNVWVEAAGHALAEDVHPELVRDLYAHAAARWVDAGHTAHYVMVPSHDGPLVDAWFRLAFGQQHVHGVREVPSSTTPTPTVDGALIRRAERRDVRDLAELELVLDEHQILSPVFGGYRPPPFEEALAEWEEQVDDATIASFVAERDGVVVGCAVGCPLSISSAHRGLPSPANAGFLALAAVRPEARGSGLGRALGETVLAWSAEVGHSSVAVDWRATNLLSSRTWPRLGFRPTFLRLHRVVGF